MVRVSKRKVKGNSGTRSDFPWHRWNMAGTPQTNGGVNVSVANRSETLGSLSGALSRPSRLEIFSPLRNRLEQHRQRHAERIRQLQNAAD